MGAARSQGLSKAGLARLMDLTLLRPDSTTAEFDRLFRSATKDRFWSVCVPPSRVPLAARFLKGSEVKVCTVVGFPFGYDSQAAKVAEARQALADGADEIDMVMNIGDFKAGEQGEVSREIEAVVSQCGDSGALLKVIIECCYLTDAEKVRAARMAEEAGADYVKTSTGFGPSGATEEDVSLLRRTLSRSVRVKAAGGIDTLQKALAMLDAGADRLGVSKGSEILQAMPDARDSARTRKLSAAR